MQMSQPCARRQRLGQLQSIINFIDMLRRAVRYKEPSMVGKLSSPRLPYPEEQLTSDKQVSAQIIPEAEPSPGFTIKKQHRGSRTVWGMGRGAGTDDPLPRVPHSQYVITQHQRVAAQTPSLNPQAQSVFFVDGRKGRVSRCIATQIDRKQQSPGQLRKPRPKSLMFPGRIKHQRVRNQPKAHSLIKPERFKDFLQHKYVREVQEQHRKKQEARNNSMIEQRHWDQGGSFMSDFRQSQYSEQPYAQNQSLMPVCFNVTVPELNRVGSSVLLRQEGHLGFFQDRIQDQENQSHVLDFMAQEDELQGVPRAEFDPKFYLDESSSDVAEIGFQGLNRVKQILIEQESGLRVSFSLPPILTRPPSTTITQPQLHDAAHKIFGFFLKIKPQLVSIRRFKNCVLISTNQKGSRKPREGGRITILWYFTGRFYVGGWWGDDSGQSEGFREGIGMQFVPQGFIHYGQYSKNCRHGYGIMKKVSCEVYAGEWSDGRRQGWGKVFGPGGGLQMDGTFRAGRFGCARFPDN